MIRWNIYLRTRIWLSYEMFTWMLIVLMECALCVVCGLIWCCYLSYGFELLFDDIARIKYLFYIVVWLHPSLDDETYF